MKIRLASLILTLFILLINISNVQAQTREQPTWLSGYFGHQEYDGDLGSELFKFNVGADWAGGIGVSQYLHRYLDFELALIYGSLDYKNFRIPDSPLKSNIISEKNFLNINALLKFKPIRNQKPVQPFIGTGVGFTPIWGTTSRIVSTTPTELEELPSNNKTAFQVPLQLGADIRITDNIYATANATYNRTFSDGLDGRGGDFDLDDRSHDDFMVYSVGFKISLNKSRDSDGDGVKDKNDLCPNNYGSSFWGCPDSDGDGIVDNRDACPMIAGRSVLDGCPDADRDGIEDSRDQCPEAAGSYQNNGCPNDSDGDGISDDQDACPDQTGDQSNNGCPEDADQDGILNTEDKCPQEAGVASNNGCPKEKMEKAEKKEKRDLDESIKEDLKNIIERLLFGINSANLDPSSHDELDRLAQIMLNDQELRLIIRGHTDNTGDSNANLELSVNRANAVKDYLVQQGVQATRVAAFGYGETRPIASNDTQEGREKNRRVELDLYYQQ